jgi:hypothetical protein
MITFYLNAKSRISLKGSKVKCTKQIILINYSSIRLPKITYKVFCCCNSEKEKERQLRLMRIVIYIEENNKK